MPPLLPTVPTGLTDFLPDAEDVSDEQKEEMQETGQEWRESNQEAFEQLAEARQRGDLLGEASNIGKLMADATLDAPGASVQDTTRGVLLESYQLGKGDQSATEEEFAREVQEASIEAMPDESVVPTDLLPDEEKEVVRAGDTAVTFNPKRAGDAIGSMAGFAWDALLVEPVSGIAGVTTGINPMPGREAGVLDEPPEEAEVTGSTEATPAPETYIFDVLTVGAGSAATTGGKAAARVGDDVAAEAGPQLGRLTARGTTQSANMGIFDDLAQVGIRQAPDELPSIADDVPTQSVDDLVGQSFDEFVGRTPTSPSTADEFTSGTLTARESAEGTIDLSGMVPRSIDDTDFGARTVQELRDVGVRVGDESTAEVSRPFSEIFDEGSGSLGDLAPDFLRGGDEGASAVDESASVADESQPGTFGTIFDEFNRAVDDFARGGDEGAPAADDFARTADSDTTVSAGSRLGDQPTGTVSRAGDDIVRGADEVEEAATGGSIRSLAKSAGLVGAGGLLGGLGVGFGLQQLDDSDAPPGPATINGWTYEHADTLRQGDNVAIIVSVALQGNVLGYAAFVSDSQVLTEDGGTRRAAISLSSIRSSSRRSTRSQTENPREQEHLEPTFGSVSAARNAFNAYVGGNNGGDSEVWDGSLDGPGSVEAGKGFTVEASVQNSAGGERAASFVLAVRTDDGTTARLGSRRQRVSPGGAVSFTYDVRQTTKRLSAGDYTLLMVAQGDGGGKVASDSLSVGGGGGGQSDVERSDWGDTSIVGELGGGWYLVAQRKKDGSDTRYMVAGKRDDGTRIYLSPGGTVRSSPHFFDDRQSAQEAFRAWAERAQRGDTSPSETPSTSGGRPSTQGIQQDAASKDSGPLSILKENPAAVAGLAVLILVFYTYSDGSVSGWLESQYNSLKGAI